MFDVPLTKANRLQFARIFRQVKRVDISIDCVIEGQMGKAFFDNPDHPTVFQIQTGPFIYLAGDPVGTPAQELLRSIPVYTLLMPSGPGWMEAAQAFFGDRLQPVDRYSLSSEPLSREHLKTACAATPFDGQIERMGDSLVQGIWGQDHFIDLSDYDSPADFLERGIGYTYSQQGNVVGAAYASLVCSRSIEVSIYVVDDYRRQGLATALASCLLGWCLEHGLEPHWDAANPESWRLASKLGYNFIGSYEAHYLWKN